jgi:tetratricopeptide (TPR) repeat protein
MKKKFFYTLLSIVLFGYFGAYAQEGTCDENLSLEHDFVKARKYDEALTYWNKLIKDCPKHSEAIYADGTKIFKTKLKQAQKAGDEAKAKEYLNTITDLYDKWLSYFPNSKNTAKIYHDKGLVLLNNKAASKEELYDIFTKGYTLDKNKFTNPKAIYGYFDAAVEMYKNNKLTFEELINHYNDLGASIEKLSVKYSLEMDKLQKKEEAGELMKKEEKKLKAIRKNLPVYAIVAKNMDKILGELGDCEHLVPLYKKTYEENKDNASWLRKAAANLSKKDCSNDPIFEKLVVQLNNLEPSYSSSYYLGILKEKKGNISESVSYYKKAIDLSDNAYDKAKIYFKLARLAEKRGQRTKARGYAYDALKYRPSMGSAYLLIARLYAKSANDCGTDEFSKRATYWLAASMADKAAKVDPTKVKTARKMAAAYRAKAPGKTDVFMKGMAGKKIQMKCWIGGSVTVPNQ